MLEEVRFDFFLDRIGEFHSLVGKKFYAVIPVRIVRGGDDDAGVKIILANEARNPGSRKNSRERDGGAAVEKASCNDTRDMRAGFARISAYEGMG